MLTDNTPSGFNQDAFDRMQSAPPTPDALKSFGAGAIQAFTAPYVAGIDLMASMSDIPSQAEGANAAYEMLNQDQQGAPIASGIGNIVGTLLNPIGWAGGALGEGIGAGAGFMASKIPTYGAGISKVITPIIGGGLGAEGAMLPSDIAENYNAQKNDIDWGGVASAAPKNIGIGMVIGATHLALGTIIAKIKASKAGGESEGPDDNSSLLGLPAPQPKLPPPQGKLPPPQPKLPAPNPKLGQEPLADADLEDALNQGVINQDEYNFAKAHQQGADSFTLMKLANKVTAGYGEGESITIPLLTNDDIRNMSVTAADELASGVGDDFNPALSEYIVNNNIDNIRSNDTYMNALKGFSAHIAPRLEQRDSTLASLDGGIAKQANSRAEFKTPIDQQAIYDATKAGKETNLTIPKEVQERLDHEQNIADLKAQVVDHDKEIKALNRYLKGAKSKTKIAKANKRIASLTRKIKDKNRLIPKLEAKPPELLDVKEELHSLKDRLLSGEITPAIKLTHDYERLSELSDTIDSKSPYAKLIKARIDQKLMYDQQASIKQIADNLIAMNKLGLPRQADLERVKNYLKSRIESKVQTARGEMRPTYNLQDFMYPYEKEPFGVMVNPPKAPENKGGSPKPEEPKPKLDKEGMINQKGEPIDKHPEAPKNNPKADGGKERDQALSKMKAIIEHAKGIDAEQAKAAESAFKKAETIEAKQKILNNMIKCLRGSV